MPISRKRKKKGKRVKGHGAVIKIDPNKESSISLQDLIDVVAYQEFKAGKYDPPAHVEPLVGENTYAGGVEAYASEIHARVWTNEDTEIAPNVIVRADAVVNIPDSVPVNIENTRGEKIGIGTASPIEGDPGHVSIHITDPAILNMLQVPLGDYSIADKETHE